MTVATREYTDVGEMLADYAARRRRFFHTDNVVRLEVPQASVPVAVEQVATVPECAEPEDIPEFLSLRRRVRDWVDLTEKESVRPSDATIIIRLVVERFGVSKRDILSHRRTAAVVKPRMVACWLMRNFTTMSLPMIGRKLGRRDHTTVLNAVRKIDALRARDAAFRGITDELGVLAEKGVGECVED